LKRSLEVVLFLLVSLGLTSFVASADDAADKAAKPAADAVPAKELHFGSLNVTKVFYVGNSITYHPPAEGQSGFWGMSASAKEKDYVHVLNAKIAKEAGGEPQILVRNLADFERGLLKYDVKAGIKDELAAEPGVVIVALGENVPAMSSDALKKEFAAAFSGFLEELKKHGKPAIFVRSCFWADAAKDEIMKKAALDAGCAWIDIGALGKVEANAARSERKIQHPGIGGHPGDRGMQAIADAIWPAIEKAAATK
jgi:hypothetical protein